MHNHEYPIFLFSTSKLNSYFHYLLSQQLRERPSFFPRLTLPNSSRCNSILSAFPLNLCLCADSLLSVYKGAHFFTPYYALYCSLCMRNSLSHNCISLSKNWIIFQSLVYMSLPLFGLPYLFLFFLGKINHFFLYL